eukprot:g19693.t1
MPEPASLADENPVAKAYRVWSSTCPFVARSTMLLIVGIWFLSFIMPELQYALRSGIEFTIMHFEVYRLITTVFCSGGVMTVIFGIMSFNRIGPNLERSLGSTGLLALMTSLTVATNVAFMLLSGLLVMLGNKGAVLMSSGGIWNLIIALTAVECMATPNVPRKFFILPYDIPGKYYPVFLAFVYSIMGRSGPDLFVAMGVGYAYATGRLDRLKPSRSRLSNWESGCLANFVQRPGYILSGAAMGAAAFGIPLNNPADHPSNQRSDVGGGGGGLSSMFGGGGGGGGDNGDGGEGGFGSNNVIKRGGGGTTSGSSFAGSGQTLGSGGGSSRSSSRSQTQHDAETARRARLAALEGRSGGGEGSGAQGGRSREGRGEEEEAAAPLLSASDHDVLTLQDMGFTAAEAREALRFTNGDVDAAASYLSA